MIRLPVRKERFCQEYLVDLNGKEAIKRASETQIAEQTAKNTASTYLADPKVAMRIIELQKERMERTKVSQDKTLFHLAAIGYSDIRNYLKWTKEGGVEFKDSSELDHFAAAAISEITEVKAKDGTRTIKFKLAGKTEALSLLGKHQALFVERHEVTGIDGTPLMPELTVALQRAYGTPADPGSDNPA